MIDDIYKDENYKIRRLLGKEILSMLSRKEMTQTEIAYLFKTNQPRVSHLLDGQFESFRIDTLINYLIRLGVKVEISFHIE